MGSLLEKYSEVTRSRGLTCLRSAPGGWWAIRTTQVLKEAAAVRPQLWPQIVRSAPPPQRCRSGGQRLCVAGQTVQHAASGEAKVGGVRHVGTGAKLAK